MIERKHTKTKDFTEGMNTAECITYKTKQSCTEYRYYDITKYYVSTAFY